MAESPSIDFLISVFPQAMYIFMLSGNLTLIDYLPIKLSRVLNVFESAPFKTSISLPFERRIAQVPKLLVWTSAILGFTSTNWVCPVTANVPAFISAYSLMILCQ